MEIQASHRPIRPKRHLKLVTTGDKKLNWYLNLWKNADLTDPDVRSLWSSCSQDIFKYDEENSFFEFLCRVQAAEDENAMIAFLKLAEDIKEKKRISDDQISLVLKYGLKQMKGADLSGLIIQGSLTQMDLRDGNLSFLQVQGDVRDSVFTYLTWGEVMGSISDNKGRSILRNEAIKGSINGNQVDFISFNQVGALMSGNCVKIDMVGNRVKREISGNIVSGDLYGNTGAFIYNNTVSGEVYGNKETRDIYNNTEVGNESGSYVRKIFYYISQYFKSLFKY